MAQSGQSAADAFQRAFRHHQAGQLQQAEALYRQVLAVHPNHADSLHLLGIIARQMGQPLRALEYLDKAIKIQPRAAAYRTSRGNALKDLGRTKEAETAYRDALGLQRDFPEALSNLGGLLVELGRFSEAENVCRDAVRARPDYGAHINLGLALAGRGRLEEAVACYREAVRLRPDAPEAHNHLGRTLDRLDRSVEGESCLREALRLRPDFADAHNNLGIVYRNINRTASAEAFFRTAVGLRPDFAEAHINLANTLHLIGRAAEAEPHGRAAVRLDPKSADAHNCLGLALSGLGRHAEAEESYREALRLRPDFAGAHNNLGNALKELGQLHEAEASFREALRLQPGQSDASKGLALVLLAQRKFAEASAYVETVLATIVASEGGWRVLLGSLLYVPDLSPDEHFEKRLAFGRAMAERAKSHPLPPLTNDRTPGRRLRIGWLSSDFHQHPVARNIGMMFRHRDRKAFETFCYADVKRPDPLTEAFQRQTDTWRSITGLDDAAAAEMIRADQIDIMIYLAGHFDDNRPQVAAWRAAPVQISMLDAATSGVPGMDYFLADDVLTPAHRREKFSERVLRLPMWYVHEPPLGGPVPGPPPCLTGDGVKFASFHNPSKLHPKVFGLWGDVLRRLPDARIQFQYMERFADKPLQETVRRDLGEDVSSRVNFGVFTRPIGEHLEAYNHVDISLDPFPFTGSTATFEALWMGVPVVTLAGDTFVSRLTASTLAKVGLDDLIATTPEAYAEIAVRLATDRARLADLRRTLRETLVRSVVCDGPRATRYFERALRAVWRKWCRDGNAPEIGPATAR
jgi:protein O-GlcNAc transferase